VRRSSSTSPRQCQQGSTQTRTWSVSVWLIRCASACCWAQPLLGVVLGRAVDVSLGSAASGVLLQAQQVAGAPHTASCIASGTVRLVAAQQGATPLV
jgi:hypothetical protein